MKKRTLTLPLRRLLDYYRQLQAVRDVAQYVGISVFEALRRARVKDTPAEDMLWNEFPRESESDYRDYYARNVHYIERQDWYNRNQGLTFLDYIPRFGNLLDYGCGTAYAAFKAKQKRPDINLYLADIPKALTKDFAQWRLRKYKIEYVWYDIPEDERVQFDAEFDFICCHDVLEHTFHPDIVMRNFWANLKSGGTLSFDFVYDPSFKKENTKQAQRLRDTTLEYVEQQFKVLVREGDYYLVQKACHSTGKE